jgi:hypothetical protein
VIIKLDVHQCAGQAVPVTDPLDGFAGTEPDDAPAPSRRRAALVLVAAAIAAVLVGLVAVVALHTLGNHPKRSAAAAPSAVPGDPPTSGDPSAPAVSSPEPATTPKPTLATTPAGAKKPTPGQTTAPPPPPAGTPPPAPTPPGGCTTCEMPGDGTVPVGGTDPKGVRAGQYHSDGPANGGTCSWWLAKDPAGDDQVAGKTVDHPTDVIVSDGMYFHSEGCRVWRWIGRV